MSKRQTRKGVKQTRRRKKLREEARRPRTASKEKDTPGQGHERICLDPYSHVAWRDAKKNTRLFWNHQPICSYLIGALSADSRTDREFAFGENAQKMLRPLVEEMLNVIRIQAQSREAMRWLVLVRPNLRTFLGEFMDGRGYSGLSKQDHLGVLGMLELSITEYGQRKTYFATYRQKGPPDGTALSEYATEISPISEEDIIAIRNLLDSVVILYRLEKLFRVSGRGTGISIDALRGITLFTPKLIRGYPKTCLSSSIVHPRWRNPWNIVVDFSHRMHSLRKF